MQVRLVSKDHQCWRRIDTLEVGIPISYHQRLSIMMISSDRCVKRVIRGPRSKKV